MIEFTPEINAATESVHAWLRSEILRKLAVAPVDVSKPLREPEKPKAREIVPRAKSVRKLRASERKPRAPRVRKTQAIPGMPPSNYRDDINLEVIIECWQQGLDMNQIAAKLNCHRSAVNKRLVVARQDAEFRQVEAELTKCAKCGKPKRQYRDNCCLCEKRATRGKVGSFGGYNRKTEVNIDAILECWRKGMDRRETAKFLGCVPKVITDRLREANQNPEHAAAITAMRTCRCGRSKLATAEKCRNCNQREYQRRVRSRPNIPSQIDRDVFPDFETKRHRVPSAVTG